MNRILAGLRSLVRTTGLGLLIALLVLVCATWGFFAVASEVLEGETQSFDERIVLAARNPADPSRVLGPPFATEAARDITALGGVVVITLITVLVAGFLLLAGKRRAFVFVVVAVSGGTALSLGLKQLYARPRPGLVPHLSEVITSSFPSGHSTLSAVVYLTLAALLSRLVAGRAQKVYLLVTAVLLTFLVGASRVVMGVHYPTDVLAGWTVGLAWALTCWAVMHFLQRRGAVEPPAESPGRSAP